MSAKDTLNDLIQQELSAVLTDIQVTGVKLDEPLLVALADINEITTEFLSIEYLVGTLVIHELRLLMITPKGTLQ